MVVKYAISEASRDGVGNYSLKQRNSRRQEKPLARTEVPVP